MCRVGDTFLRTTCFNIILLRVLCSITLNLDDGCHLYLAPSKVIRGGVGIFAGIPISNSSISSPAVSVAFNSHYLKNWQLKRYVYDSPIQFFSMLEFGPPMIYNHHERNNAMHVYSNLYMGSETYFVEIVRPQYEMFQPIKAHSIHPLSYYKHLDDIGIGEEIFSNYGVEYFTEARKEGLIVLSPTKEEAKYSDLAILQSVGHCLSNVYIDDSIIPDAGFGVFSNQNFEPGQLIEVSPVLVAPKYEVYEISDHTSVLINYFFSTSTGTVALVPISTVGVMNHGGKNGSNVAFDSYFWPEGEVKGEVEGESDEQREERQRASAERRRHKLMLNTSAAEVLTAYNTRLFWAYRATRPIRAGDEMLIDYGDDWERSWASYQESRRTWKMYARTYPIFRRHIDMPAGMMPSKWQFGFWRDRVSTTKKTSVR